MALFLLSGETPPHNYVTHLHFADDLLVFVKDNKPTLQKISAILDDFNQVSGQTINKEKSKIYFTKGCNNKEELRDIMGFFPTKYLGMPLSPSYLKPTHYSSLIDKCRGKIEGWSMHALSF